MLFPLAVAAIVVAGLGLRLGDWRAAAEHQAPLLPDTQEYLTIAHQMRHFYWPSSREPLHPALIRAATWMVGPGREAPRLVSFTFSNLLVLVTALVGWRLYGRWPALVASAFVAFHPYWLYRSTEGLRLELYGTLLLVFVWLTAERAERGRSVRLLVAGVVGGLLCLVRMTSLVFVVPVVGWFLIRGGRAAPHPQPEGEEASEARRDLRPAAAVALILLVLIIAPYLYVCHRDLGDALIWVNRHARWWRYRELQEGLAGSPPSEGVPPAVFPGPAGPSRTAEAPVRVTVWGYLLGCRPVGESVGRMLRGYGQMGLVFTRIFATERLYGVTARLGWLGLLGLAVVLRRGSRLPVVTAVLSLLPVSLVVPLGANPRLYMHVLPLWLMWCALGVQWPLQGLCPRGRTPPG